jgi:hypothetical protein
MFVRAHSNDEGGKKFHFPQKTYKHTLTLLVR